MAIKNLKLKSNLKKQIEQESKGGKDTRFLNYYDLKEGEKMTILLLPDTNGELWAKFSKHGPNLRTPGIEPISCARISNRVDCPACQKGFDLNNTANETGDKSFKDEAKKWFPKNYTLVQCLVLESPMDISESPDGNQVKLVYLPYAIEELIKEAVIEDQVSEEELPMTPFVIKKTKNDGGYASYANSFFSRKQVTDDQLAFFDDLKVEQYDFSEIDVIPTPSTTEEVKEWLQMAEAKLEQAQSGGSSGNSQNQGQSQNLKDRISSTPKEDDKEDKSHDEGDGQEAKEESKAGDEAPSRGSSLRDRLRASRS